MDGAGDRRHRRSTPKPTPAERRAERGDTTELGEVLDAAARLLEARQRSVDEMRRRLRGLGYPGGLVEECIARLLELRYLDDDAFARTWVESRDRARPRGERALRTELARKGVERDTVDAVLEDRRADADAAVDADGASPDDAAAERLLRKRLSAIMRVADPRARLQRAYALLARAGFAPDICSAAARRVLAAEAGATTIIEDEI
jgi:regulatory protein